jgi:hypothetical protein
VADLRFPRLDRPALFDTGDWTWARDRRFPELTAWFNAAVEAGLVLVCDLVIIELTRLAPNEGRAREVSDRLAAFEAIPDAGRALGPGPRDPVGAEEGRRFESCPRYSTKTPQVRGCLPGVRSAEAGTRHDKDAVARLRS